MKITIIGVVPPCPRCKHIHDLTVQAVQDLGVQADIKKIAFDSDEAQRYGRIGTAHSIADWANIDIDWNRVRALAAGEWSKELDDVLMPCKEKADAQGWLMTPVLLIDGRVAFTGYVPSKEDIQAAITGKGTGC